MRRFLFNSFTFILLCTLTLFHCSSDSSSSAEDATENTLYSVGGTLTGLFGSIVLQNNNADDLTLETDQAFSFSKTWANNAPYNVTIATQPDFQSCIALNPSGIINAQAVNAISINCIPNAPTFSLSNEPVSIRIVIDKTNVPLNVNSFAIQVSIGNMNTDYSTITPSLLSSSSTTVTYRWIPSNGNGTYNFRVRAVDANQQQSDWTQVQSLVFIES